LNLALNSKEVRLNFDRIRHISGQVEERLTSLGSQDAKTTNIIKSLSDEELQDVSNLLQIANFLLVKYESSKEMRGLVKGIVDIIELSASDVETIDDEIHELAVSAESIVKKIKDAQGNISTKFDLCSSETTQKKSPNSCSINLTNSSTEFHTYGYQQSSQEETAQVI